MSIAEKAFGSPPVTEPLSIPLSHFSTVEDLQQRGLYLQAYHRLAAIAPDGKLDLLTDPAHRVMAARLTHHVGAPEASTRLLRKTFHAHRTHAETTYYYCRHLWDRRGALAALRFHQARGDELPGASRDVQADWLAARGSMLGFLRDFDDAQRWLDRALALAPDNPWLRLEQATFFEHQDRYDDAIAAANEVLAARQWYRPAVQHAAHLYQLVGKDTDALDLMREASAHLESAFLLMQLAGLEQELSLYADARQTIERLSPLMPLMEKPLATWLRHRRCDLAYWCGDYATFLDVSKDADDPFLKAWSERVHTYLASGGTPPPPDKLDTHAPHRVRLPVGFVRQHHLTCVPATLSILCRFWDKPADHLAIADRICYDGTPSHKEREWATSAGFVTREFTLTWETGVALIDRGIPFALTTVAPERGHAQAVIGYDAFRRTFLIRDPYARAAFEFDADATLRAFRSSGPRCMVLVPQEHAARLDGISLPDADHYDHLYVLQMALEVHDRQGAQRALDALSAAAPTHPPHRLTLYAQRCIASYDANRTAVLAVTEELLAQYPEDANLQLSKLASLRDLARRQDRIILLREICSKKGSDPVFWRRLAEELLGDAREAGFAERLLERCLRRHPQGAAIFAALASALWERRQFDRAFPLFRVAACLDDKDERFARSYVLAARHFKKTAEALDFLRARVERLGSKSSAPARTLFDALAQLDRDTEAFAILEAALLARPDDPDLLLFAANVHVRYGKEERGLEFLARAERVSYRLAWLFTAAEIAGFRCRPDDALALWRQIAAQDPLCMDAHRAIARLLAETEGRAAALAYLRAEVDRFPHHYQLAYLLILWERQEDLATREATIRRIIAIDSAEAWGHRELAILLAEEGRDAEALAAAEEARKLEPDDDATLNTLAYVHERAGRVVEARAWYRIAIRHSVDNQVAVNGLMAICPTTQERREELKILQAELIRQVIFGDSLIAFRRHASLVLDPPEVLAQLREAKSARPDLWQAWSALMLQLADMGQLDEAEKIGKEAVERMPMLARLWVDLSQVYAARGEPDARAAALEEALAVSPNWTLPSRLLATVHESRHDLLAARRILEQAITREPLEPYNHGYLAQIHWKLGHPEAALYRLDHALRLGPDLQDLWSTLNHWGRVLKQPNLALDKMREITARQAGDPAAWRRLATVLPDDAFDEALATIEKAIALEPRNPENHDLKAQRLGAARRFAEAAEACRPAVFGNAIPPLLEARRAWLLGEQGRPKEAIAAMEAVLAVDQSNYWAWQRLADWYGDLGDSAGYLKIVKRMAALWPRDAGVLEYLAHARLGLDAPTERTQAKAELQRVLEIDPDRAFAADTLFSLQLEDRQLDAAAHTLALIHAQARPATALLREAQLALVRDDLDTATRATKEMLALPTLEPRHLRALLDAAAKNRAGQVRIEDALITAAQTVSAQPAVPAVAAAGVRLLAKRQGWDAAFALLARLPHDSPAFHAAASDLLDAIGSQTRGDLAAKIHATYAATFARDDTLWGMMGYAFSSSTRWRQAEAWLADYRKRKDLRAWMLMNLAMAYWHTGRTAAAAEVHRLAATLPPDGATDGHLIWLACLEPWQFCSDAGPHPRKVTLSGGPLSLDNVQIDRLRPDEKFAHDAAQVAIAAARAGKGKVTVKHLGPAWKSFGKRWTHACRDPLIRTAYRHVARQLLRTGTLSLRLQALLLLARG
jgi:tetratricopeptide (TPR) repeat protein